MITVNGIEVRPTIFPDKTSQMWKLEEALFNCEVIDIRWNFEEERELIDIAAIHILFRRASKVNLFMPYLPYGRQDKAVDNHSTFNLRVFGDLINHLRFSEVRTLDAHNPKVCADIFDNFVNEKPDKLHAQIIKKIKPDFIVYPDYGAFSRYQEGWALPAVCITKKRDQQTGQITEMQIDSYEKTLPVIKGGRVALIIDDICDGGRTFTDIASMLKAENPNLKIHLFVTHGIFSKGKDHLLKNKIDFVHTTDSVKQYTEMEIYHV